MIPVIYELDNNDEATGTTYRFCSYKCLAEFDKSLIMPCAIGEEPTTGFVGEQCCTCGAVITIGQKQLLQD